MADLLLADSLIAIPATELDAHAGRTDVAIVTVGTGDESIVLALPQFGLEVSYPDRLEGDRLRDAISDAFRDLIQQAVTFYQALVSLPPDYRTDIEQAQLQVFQLALFPWFAETVGGNPGAWTAPADMLQGVELV